MISARSQIDELAAGARDAQGTLSPADVRRMRIAARRLSVWLDLGGRRALRDDLAWLRRTLAPVRDLDVLAELGAGAPWADDLAAQREHARGETARALAGGRLAGLIQALGTLPGLQEEKARAVLPRLVERLLRAAGRLQERRLSLERLHRLRRRLRDVRYAYEWLGLDLPELAGLQRSLGLVNNLATSARHLERIAETHDVRSELAAVEAAIAEQRDQALASWAAVEARFGEGG